MDDSEANMPREPPAHSICEVCKLECGPFIAGAKVYHWDCAFSLLKEVRDEVLKRNPHGYSKH